MKILENILLGALLVIIFSILFAIYTYIHPENNIETIVNITSIIVGVYIVIKTINDNNKSK